MARYTGPVCRLCRRDGTKLFLKGAKCFSEKCPVEKRNFPPGQHGQSRRSRRSSATVSSFARSRRPSASTSRSRPSSAPTTRRPPTRPASPANSCSSSLRPASTTSATASASRSRRRQARQVVRHGHVQVNGRKVNIPSFQCKVGDEIADPRRLEEALVVLEESKNFASGQRSVPWLDINRDNLSGKVIALPKREDVNLPVNEQLIVELY